MITYIAFIRGINVGGKNIIKMADLKQMFEGLGFNKVQTYIQSGNVLFRSEDEEEVINRKIENEIKTRFGLNVSVVLRNADEIEQIITACPYTVEEITKAQALTEAEVFYVALLPKAPTQKNIEIWDSYRTENDEYRIIGREVYLLLKHSIRDSKLAGSLNKLGVAATVRNWKTINKLAAMAKYMGEYKHKE